MGTVEESNTATVVNEPDSLNYQKMLADFVAAKEQQRESKAKLAEANATIERIEPFLIEQFIAMGQSSVKVNGFTIYTSSTLWANAMLDEVSGERDWHSLNQALFEVGAGELVPSDPRPNIMSLSAWVRELPKDEIGQTILPKALEGRIQITKKPELRTRKASK